MKNVLLTVITGLALLGLVGCGTTEKKEEQALNKQVEKQPAADTPEMILARAAQSFSSIEGLDAAKKDKLRDIYTRVYTDSMSIRREIGQSKSLLFSTLAKPEYKTSEIAALKKKIVGLDEKRLALMFKALDEVQTVIGKGPGREEIFKRLERYEIPGRMMSDY